MGPLFADPYHEELKTKRLHSEKIPDDGSFLLFTLVNAAEISASMSVYYALYFQGNHEHHEQYDASSADNKARFRNK